MHYIPSIFNSYDSFEQIKSEMLVDLYKTSIKATIFGYTENVQTLFFFFILKLNMNHFPLFLYGIKTASQTAKYWPFYNRNKVIWVWNNMRVIKLWHFNFRVIYHHAFPSVDVCAYDRLSCRNHLCSGVP